MKLDVEGHEAQVLQGAAKFFERTPPDAVTYESADRYYQDFQKPRADGTTGAQTDADELPFRDLPTVRFFRSFGYDLYSIGRSYLRVNLVKIDPQASVHPRGGDILAIRKDRTDAAQVLGLHLDR